MKSELRKSIIISMVINIVFPYTIYSLLMSYTDSLHSLMAATCFPLLDTLYNLIRFRKFDPFSSFMLFGFILAVLMVFLGGSEKLLLVRESIVTGIIGMVFILSLFFFKRPLIYHFALRFTVEDDPDKKSRFASHWNYPYFRFIMRLMTGVWGLITLLEAVVKVYLAYTLTPSVFLATSGIITYSFIGFAIGWTIWYRKRSIAKFKKILQ